MLVLAGLARFPVAVVLGVGVFAFGVYLVARFCLVLVHFMTCHGFRAARGLIDDWVRARLARPRD